MALLDCTDEGYNLESLIRGCFVRMDDDSFALRTVETADGDAIACADVNLDTEGLLRGAIVRIATDQYAFQITPVS